jgi:hypothetical protein
MRTSTRPGVEITTTLAPRLPSLAGPFHSIAGAGLAANEPETGPPGSQPDGLEDGAHEKKALA